MSINAKVFRVRLRTLLTLRIQVYVFIFSTEQQKSNMYVLLFCLQASFTKPQRLTLQKEYSSHYTLTPHFTANGEDNKQQKKVVQKQAYTSSENGVQLLLQSPTGLDIECQVESSNS